MQLQKKLDKFLASVGSSPAQKSAEWYSLKAKTIGGSEVATVLGLNPFKNLKSLIAEKVGITGSGFSGNIATRWGTIFESVTRDWTQLVLGLDKEIQETGSLPGIIAGQRYSPDGLGIVGLLNANDELDYYIVLFEFKSPFKSLPDGKIPKHYRPQIQTGMLTIPMVELSIFVNNCYRKCAIGNIGFDMTYDTIFHDGDAKKKKTKKQMFTDVLACGLIGFYQTKENYDLAVNLCGYGSDSDSDNSDADNSDVEGVDKKITADDYMANMNPSSNYSSNAYDMEILMNTRNTILDFGECRQRMIERLFELYEEKRIQIVYYPMVLNQEAVNKLEFIQLHKKDKTVGPVSPKKIIKMQLRQFTNFCEEKDLYPIGYLPWKLFKSDILSECPDSEWRKTIEEPITKALSIIDEIQSSSNPEESYYELYPCHEATEDMVSEIEQCSDMMTTTTIDTDSEVE